MRLYKVVGDIPKHRYQTSHAILHPRTKTLRQGSLAVLPFEVIGSDEEQRYFADGLTDDLIVELARFKHLFVSSQSAVSSYEPKTADPRVVGRELGVEHVLFGQVRRIGERVRISVRLVDQAAERTCGPSAMNGVGTNYSNCWTSWSPALPRQLSDKYRKQTSPKRGGSCQKI